MRKTLKGIALAIAGCSTLAAPAAAQDASSLHDQVRARVCQAVGEEAPSADAVRSALASDPDFGRLLESLRRAAIGAASPERYAEDSLQETMLKIWRGRPDIFLRGHDEVLRYVRSATRRNAITQVRRERFEPLEPFDVVPSRTAGPSEVAAATDLLEELESSLDEDEREVFSSLIEGVHSRREIARQLGETRYAAGRSVEGIELKLDLLREEG